LWLGKDFTLRYILADAMLCQALMEAIKSVTDMNQDLSVEKIEIQTNAERV